MKWLLIAVITAVVAVIGALVTFVLFSRRKRPQKTLFKKTYATGIGMIKETNSKTEPLESDAKPAPMDTQPVQATDEKIHGDPRAAYGQSKPPETIAGPVLPGAETSTADTGPSQVIAQTVSAKVESLQPAAATAQTAAEAEATEAETIQTAAQVTEFEPESPPKEEISSQTQQTSHFITEIESEPPQIKAKPGPEDVAKPAKEKREETQPESEITPLKEASKPVKAKTKKPKIDAVKDEESSEDIKSDTPAAAAKTVEKPDEPQQTDPSDQILETLNSGKLDDWIDLTQSPLTPENFQAVVHKIAKATYPKRKNKKMRTIFKTQAQKYVDEFEIKTPADPISEYIYKSLAIVLQEDRKFEKAMDLCRKAIDLDMDDGTKTGYSGRIVRLKKAKANKK